MILKNGNSLQNLQPQMVVAMIVANDVYRDHGYVLCVSSGYEGPDSYGILHSLGLAIDLRTRTIPVAAINKLAAAIKDDLNEGFDVVVELDHIHIEFNPK